MSELVLKFEKPIVELEEKISQMKISARRADIELDDEIARLEMKLEKVMVETYSRLSRWERVQLAKHVSRPHSSNYIDYLVDDFIELHGDRLYADDPALIAGIGTIATFPVIILGQEKGRSTKEKIHRNFGMMHPEGYRKALRLMKMADKFNKPVVVFIDTPGAYPGLCAEERGQGEAIARNLFEMARLRIPVIAVIIGEGASGGALGIGLADKVLMLENAWYSVISPEGCAAILWRDAGKADSAAEVLKPTAKDLLELGVIDEIIPEPSGGAHRKPEETAAGVKERLIYYLETLSGIDPDILIQQRLEKYGDMGFYSEK
ncbi:acetyl-CoA carboxylase carboxyltransferase subunit alpha [bacterium]|nr:acetyl-CoA carboxylase carboxyltransferase subunit alpha [bacterium]